MATRTIWKGAISFGLVHIPVGLHTATTESGVDFDWTYAADFAITAIVAGLLLGQELRERAQAVDPAVERAQPGQKARLLSLACVVVGIALLGLSAWAIRHGNHTIVFTDPQTGDVLDTQTFTIADGQSMSVTQR